MQNAEKLQSGFIVWSPTGATPPRKIHDTATEALDAARSMSERHRGQLFYALAIIGSAHSPTTCNACGREYEEDIPF